MTDNSQTELDELIEQRIKIASTQQTSFDEVVRIAWLADGIDLWHRSNGKMGHSPVKARRYIISSVSRLLDSYTNKRELQARIDELEQLIPEPVAEMVSIDYEDELKRAYDNIHNRIAELKAQQESK